MSDLQKFTLYFCHSCKLYWSKGFPLHRDTVPYVTCPNCFKAELEMKS